VISSPAVGPFTALEVLALEGRDHLPSFKHNPPPRRLFGLGDLVVLVWLDPAGSQRTATGTVEGLEDAGAVVAGKRVEYARLVSVTVERAA
jgi:hypothetical protein